MPYEAVIGFEVHAQLLTRSKMFCGCGADYAAAPPNTRVCPICLGMPGVLPVINRAAIEMTVLTGLALHCQVAGFSRFARKNYNYPDLMKGYQISQYELPLCRDGWVEFDLDGETHRVGIQRVHLEEDTAKLTHVGGVSLIDVNRSGVPLMEIVSAPDLRGSEAARQYLMMLRTILRYLGVSSGNMEEGSMRCEANVSLRPVGSKEFGTKVEVKNLNSFRAAKLALEYEIARQTRVLESGARVEQVTMGWDEAHGVTVVQRTKETSEDYRYFPEPDLPPLAPGPGWVEHIRARMPELPDARRDRFVARYGLSPYDARVLTSERKVADYFEAAVAAGPELEPRVISNWMSGELFRVMNQMGLEIDQLCVGPAELSGLLTVVENGVVGAATAKAVLGEACHTGEAPTAIIARRGLTQISDLGDLARIAQQVITDNPKAVADYLTGKETVFKFLLGQVMRATKGQANPAVASEALRAALLRARD